MPAKKVNVLSRFLFVFRYKKSPEEDIVTIADKVVRDYIYSKNKFIRKKCRKNSRFLSALPFIVIATLGIALIIVNIAR